MTISNELLRSYKIARASVPIEDFLKSIRIIILKNTPKELHERIDEKFKNLKIDRQKYGASSEFDEKTNTLYINPDHITDKNVYLHEFMHFIGTENFGDYINIGLNTRNYFKINDNIISSNFGYGANEGLNQHYTEDFIEKYDKISPVSQEYSFCANIMSSLEKLVGKECKIAHFSGKGINHLINATVTNCHLPNENKIVKLILQLDAYKTIARNHIVFGANLSPDVRIILLDTYKTLITIALIKAKQENKNILYSDIISNAHLRNKNFDYFVKYLQKDLIKYFYTEKDHIKYAKINQFKGVDLQTLNNTTKEVFKTYIDHQKIDSNIIPEHLKCGEFYNHIFLSCMVNDQKLTSKMIYTTDFHSNLCNALFDVNKNLVPTYKKEKIQLIKQIIASRNVVRCGATISDDYIIESCQDEEFALYLIDTAPQVFENIYPQIGEDIKHNPKVVYNMIKHVFTGKVQLYKLKKDMQNIIETDPKIKEIFEKFDYRLQTPTTQNLNNK